VHPALGRQRTARQLPGRRRGTRVKGKSTVTIGSFTDTYFTRCVGPYDTTAEDPNLEPDDSPCFRAGDTHGGTAAPNLVTGCDVFFDAIGDLDYDGTSY